MVRNYVRQVNFGNGIEPLYGHRGNSRLCHVRAATGQCACGFGVESLALTKNSCDTVVAEFFEVCRDRYRDAFHTKARSHFPITTLLTLFVVLLEAAFARGVLVARFNGKGQEGSPLECQAQRMDETYYSEPGLTSRRWALFEPIRSRLSFLPPNYPGEPHSNKRTD